MDADDVAREVVEPGTPALEKVAEHFGQEILLPGGGLDRAALRRIVFDAPEERTWLEGLLHPVIREELMRQLRPVNYSLPYVLLVSPLLLETDQHELVEKVVVVDVPVDVQIQRTMPGMPTTESRLNASSPLRCRENNDSEKPTTWWTTIWL